MLNAVDCGCCVLNAVVLVLKCGCSAFVEHTVVLLNAVACGCCMLITVYLMLSTVASES